MIPHEDEASIRERLEAGESQADIALAYSVGRSAIHKFLKDADKRRERGGVPQPDPRKRFTEAEEVVIEARYRVSGEAVETLATALGCSVETVRTTIRRVRARWPDGRPPAPREEEMPSPDNVIDFSARAATKPPKTPAPRKQQIDPVVMQREARKWLEDARLLRDRLLGLSSRFGDALVEALATSAEGEVMGNALDEMAAELRAFASTIRRDNVGRENQRNGSTGN